MQTKCFLKTWELAMLIALCAASLAGLWAQRTHEEIASQMIRLHVLAVSDEAEEQAVKLRVRDAVLEYLTPRLDGVTDRAGAENCLRGELTGIERAAECAAEGRAVTVTLSEEYYPTRVYEGFSLPAGRYTSLRVVLGEGQGQNWWCVVYPPLCVQAAEASRTAMATLDETTANIITESDGTVYRFKLLELWGTLAGSCRSMGGD